MSTHFRRPALAQLLWVGPLAIAVATLAVLTVRAAAFAALPLRPTYPPLQVGALVFFTAFFVALAVLVFAVVLRRSPTPGRTYERIALWALLLSIVPDLLLPFDPTQGGSWTATGVLIVMHIVAWWPTVRILTSLGIPNLRPARA
jgi:hypothetical protein